MKKKLEDLSDPSDMDDIDIISHPGGFAGDEDHRTVQADQEEIIGSTKLSQQSATACNFKYL